MGRRADCKTTGPVRTSVRAGRFSFWDYRMPFAGFENFAACVAANRDKENPEAYCGALQQQAEKRFTVCKLEDTRHTVYGWASVSIKHGDSLLVDYQDDMIEPAELEKAVEHYMLNEAQEVDVMHDGEPVGRLVESFFLTPEKLQVMGLQGVGAPTVGWWVGYKCHPEIYALVKARKLRMFSIYAHAAERVAT